MSIGHRICPFSLYACEFLWINNKNRTLDLYIKVKIVILLLFQQG
ncbi:unnamed protein product, partial [Arabidopsis halleri]